jgi:hypothetical protein
MYKLVDELSGKKIWRGGGLRLIAMHVHVQNKNAEQTKCLIMATKTIGRVKEEKKNTV